MTVIWLYAIANTQMTPYDENAVLQIIKYLHSA